MAIPVKNEADRIGACLLALNRQTRPPDTVLLLLNNCHDGTDKVARGLAPALGYRLQRVNRNLPPGRANAGHARGLAMRLAADGTPPDGVLLTTDADAVAPPDWIARNLAALRHGADIVCGRALIDPAESRLFPARLLRDDALEHELLGLLDTLAWTLDPEWHDPPPRHAEASGASLAMTVEAFRATGGVPDVACKEDRALVRAFWTRDARVRHAPDVRVIVSGRSVGRAPGGMAETIRRRLVRQDEFADEQIEPARDAWHRYAMRRRARRCWAGFSDATLAGDLALRPDVLRSALYEPHFGASWALLETASPRLARRQVRFADLAAEIATARSLLPAEVLAAD